MKHLRQYIRKILLTEGIQSARLHHSREGDDVNLGPYTQQSVAEQRGPVKPDGIWYDCEGQWQEFCETGFSGGYESRRYNAIYEVIPNEATVLFITNLQEFDDFENKYMRDGKYEPVIDWKRVADKHHGIEICPYQRTRRMKSNWYYSWDVASGCIWHPDGVKEMKKRC